MLQPRSRIWLALVTTAVAIIAPLLVLAKSDTTVSAAVTEKDKHTARGGETLWSISRQHGVAVGDLMDLNNLRSTSIHEGQVLKIPRTNRDIALAPTKPTSYIVSKGETFRSIARKHGITQVELEHANPKVDPDTPKPGTKLVIPHVVPDEPEKRDEGDKAPAKTVTTVVKIKVGEKDTYYSLAKKHGTTEKALIAANPGVRPEKLRPGSMLNLPAKKAVAGAGRADKKSGGDDSIADAARKTGKEALSDKNEDGTGTKPAKRTEATAEAPRTRRYRVSADETAATIAEAFDISVKKLYELNTLKPGTPFKIGQEIKVPAKESVAGQ